MPLCIAHFLCSDYPRIDITTRSRPPYRRLLVLLPQWSRNRDRGVAAVPPVLTWQNKLVNPRDLNHNRQCLKVDWPWAPTLHAGGEGHTPLPHPPPHCGLAAMHSEAQTLAPPPSVFCSYSTAPSFAPPPPPSKSRSAPVWGVWEEPLVEIWCPIHLCKI